MRSPFLLAAVMALLVLLAVSVVAMEEPTAEDDVDPATLSMDQISQLYARHANPDKSDASGANLKDLQKTMQEYQAWRRMADERKRMGLPELHFDSPPEGDTPTRRAPRDRGGVDDLSHGEDPDVRASRLSEADLALETQELDALDASHIAGVRIITCDGCRLNSLPRVRAFLENDARAYPAVEIEYISGQDPELQFLDIHRRVVAAHDISPLNERGIAELLEENGVFTWTPVPSYEDPVFMATTHCKAFRQTAHCDPDGPREQAGDASCLMMIQPGRSGYCQCSNGQENVMLPCGHEAWSCDKFCDPSTKRERRSSD
jgi:hypothetical protein